jgi:hypothetical protein
MKKHFAWIVLSILLTIAQVSPVLACSGGGSIPLSDRVEAADYVVRATVIDADDFRQNVILHVEQYLKGGAGPEYLFLAGANPALIQRAYIDRNSSNDCIFGQETLALGDNFYAILRQYTDGGYFQLGETAFGSDFYFFPTPESTVNVYLQGMQSDTVSESQFVNLITELSGETSSLPLTDSVYPAHSPLIITTSTGTDYLLPLDGSEPVEITQEILESVVLERYMSHSPYSYWGERLYFALPDCPDIDCFTFAVSGLNTAFQPDDNRILLTWGWEAELQGQEILFSPQAETAAVWNGNNLNVYLLRYPLSWAEPYGLEDNPQLIGTVPLNIAEDVPIGANYAVWSPDARTFVYSDTDGLWAWDALASESPRLLIPTVDNIIPYARYFSPQGRYLAVTAGDEHYNLDLISGGEFPNGVFSSDDRLLLALTPSVDIPELYTFSVEQIAPSASYIPFIEGTFVREAVWINNREFAAVSCVPEQALDSCDFLITNINGGIQLRGGEPLIYHGYSVVVQDEAFAAIVDRNTLLFNGTEINLTLDGDITSIRWLPSLFYHSPSN